MKIPTKIIKQGGKTLEKYANLALEAERLDESVATVEDSIYSALIDTQSLISKILINDNIAYQTVSCTHIVSHLSEENPMNVIYMAEELLKEVRNLILDGRHSYIERENLQADMNKLNS